MLDSYQYAYLHDHRKIVEKVSHISFKNLDLEFRLKARTGKAQHLRLYGYFIEPKAKRKARKRMPRRVRDVVTNVAIEQLPTHPRAVVPGRIWQTWEEAEAAALRANTHDQELQNLYASYREQQSRTNALQSMAREFFGGGSL